MGRLQPFWNLVRLTAAVFFSDLFRELLNILVFSLVLDTSGFESTLAAGMFAGPES